MKNNKEVLTSLLHTVQMGQSGIRDVRKSAIRAGLKQELDRQLCEYDSIEKEALRLATARGWDLKNLNPVVRQMSSIISHVQLMGGEVDSKIAGMLIQGNTRGLILGMKNLNHCTQIDVQVEALAKDLLNKEQINIQKTQCFL